ncbi:MAG TPA: MBL fold metallo-hydrolase [Candidatus Dormibacteraeota bacterium]|nr:MBL fold metallo-hydrolase [Candidatus Dormibacteraeota bacterium]
MKKTLLAAALVVVVALGLFLHSFAAAPLPPPPPFTGSLPPASPPAAMAVYQLPTGVTHRSAAFGYRGGSFADKRDFAMTATLVTHPRGDLLIDTGLGRHIDEQVQLMPFFFRAATSYAHTASAADLLDAAGYDRRRLRAVLLTHAHWDHTSGLRDLSGTPVWVTADERRFIADGGWITVVARSAGDVRYEEYRFDGGPYLGFPASHDVYGDGSIVVVPAPGHTPGSVIVFLALPDGRRYALIGDLAWQREGISEREERPWLQRSLADVDPAGVRDNLLRMAAIAARFPELVIVPAHDQRGFAEMPPLPSSFSADHPADR